MAHTKEHKEGDRIVGTYKSVADKKRAIRETQLDNDGNPTAEEFDSQYGSRKYTLDSKKNISKRRQKALDKQMRKDARRKKRAEKIADRKLMSTEQAQDFMRNRKDRFNIAFGNVLLDLTGNEQLEKKIPDRYYRKEGSGTIQNVAKLDKDGNPTGETYDATDPFQFSRTRKLANERAVKGPKYRDIIKADPLADLKINITPAKVDPPKKKEDPPKIQKKIVEKKKEEEISNMVNQQPGPVTIDTIGLPDRSFQTHTDAMGNIVTNRKNQQLNDMLRRNIKLPSVAEMVRKTQEEIERNRVKNLLKK